MSHQHQQIVKKQEKVRDDVLENVKEITREHQQWTREYGEEEEVSLRDIINNQRKEADLMQAMVSDKAERRKTC